MTASDDARQAIASAWGFAPGQPFYHEGMERLGDTLEVVMPDGRTIAQHLDDGAVALRVLRWMVHYGNAERLTIGGWVANYISGEFGEMDTLSETDPEGADLLARLEADR